jgi:hypothetical protein
MDFMEAPVLWGPRGDHVYTYISLLNLIKGGTPQENIAGPYYVELDKE